MSENSTTQFLGNPVSFDKGDGQHVAKVGFGLVVADTNRTRRYLIVLPNLHEIVQIFPFFLPFSRQLFALPIPWYFPRIPR